MQPVGKAISAVVAACSGVAGILVILLVAHVSAFYTVAIAFLPLALVEEKNM